MGRWKRARKSNDNSYKRGGRLLDHINTLRSRKSVGSPVCARQNRRAAQGRAGPLAGAGGGVGQLTLCRWLNSTWIGCVIILLLFPRREDSVCVATAGGGRGAMWFKGHSD